MNTSHKSVDSLNGNHFERRPQRVNVSPKWKQRRLTFNVGGTRFETYNTTLLRFPGTRLARLAKSGEADEAYDAAAGEFFFDRSPAVFALVLEYYRTGELHVDGDSCGNRVHAELDFWKLDETDIEECCWSKYTHATDTRESLAQIDRVLRAHCDYSDAWVRAATNPLLRARRYLWRAFEDPSASLFAKLLFAVSTITILLSVVVFTLETHHLFQMANVPHPTERSTCGCDRCDPLSPWDPNQWDPLPVLVYINNFCYAYFVLELLARLFCMPSVRAFFGDWMNWIDLLAVLMQTVDLVNTYYEFINQTTVSNIMLVGGRLGRIVRTLRVFKLMRHSNGFRVLVFTITNSLRELLLLVVMLFTCSLIFASLVYALESETFPNIPIGLWWAIVSMTTVGYGDIVPKQVPGYIVGSACVVCGVLAIAFAVPIVVSNFGLFYSHAKARGVRPAESRCARHRAVAADASETLLAAGIVPPCPTCGVRQDVRLMRDALGILSADSLASESSKETKMRADSDEDTTASSSTVSTENNLKAKPAGSTSVSWADQYSSAETEELEQQAVKAEERQRRVKRRQMEELSHRLQRKRSLERSHDGQPDTDAQPQPQQQIDDG